MPGCKEIVDCWHDAVNSKNASLAREAVANVIVVNGPKGAGPIGSDDFVNWIARSGITLIPLSYHPINERILVVEQEAMWTQDAAPKRVATVFRVTDGKVSAALRFPGLDEALEFARLYRALADTESQ